MYQLKLLLTFLFISASSPAQTTLDSLINQAIEVSPMLKMVQAKQNAARSKSNIYSNLPDPMLTLGVMSLPVRSLSFNEEPMTARVLGLSQEFPFPGKLSSVENSAKKDVEIVKEEFNDQRNQIIKEVTKTYYELNYIRKEIELTEASRKLMQNILEAVQSMYSVNTASQQNIFRIDLELTKMAEMISMLKGEERELLSVLNSFLLRDALTPIETKGFPKIHFYDLTTDELILKASENRPYLKSILLGKEKEQLNQKIAEYDFYPMFKVGAQYAFRGTLEGSSAPLDNMISVMVDISLPLNYGGKVSAMVEETEAMQQMYKEQYSATLQMLRREFGLINSKLTSLKERINLVENGSTIQAKENFSSALTAYQVGNIDFMNVIEAQDNLYTISKNLYRLKTDYLNQIAELEFLTGISLKEKLNPNGEN